MNIGWFIFLIILFIIAYLSNENNRVGNKYSKCYRILLILILSYIVGFGGVVATDHEEYANMYKFHDYNLSFDSIWDRNREIGYVLLNDLGHLFGLGEAGFFCLVALITNSLLVRFVYKFKSPAFSILLVFSIGTFLQQGNLVRQSLAAAVIMNSVLYLKDKRWKCYIVGVLIAASFHMSALMFLVYLPIIFINDNKGIRNLKWVLISGWLISLLVLFNVINVDILQILSSYDYYSMYSSNQNSMALELSILPIAIFNLFAIFNLQYCLKENYVMAAILVSAAIITNTTVQAPNMVRVFLYFDCIGYIYMIDYFSRIRNGRIGILKQILYYSLVAMCIARLCVNYVFSDNVLLMSKTYSWSKFFQ